jgi:hypothetical protein
MYVDQDSGCNDGILRKIEKIRDFNDPDLIDINYINFFANKMGYNVNISRGTLGLFTTSGASTYEELTGTELENANKYLRFVVKNLPNWYKIKTTKNAIKIMLFSYGVIGDIITLFTNDYSSNWVHDEEDDNINITSEVPSDYYPSPHFTIQIDIRQTAPSWIDNIENIINAIDSMRPVNTVFDRLSGIYEFDLNTINVTYGNINKSLHIYMPWTNSSPAGL